MKDSVDNSGERWQRIRAIFDDIIAEPKDQRIPLLQRRCGRDTELIAELESLIEACQAEEAFSQSVSEDGWKQEVSAPRRRWIGPYELDRLLGRGGMGAVYLAHRVDGHFRQLLAIKLIDLPLATELYRDRFRLERQILAKLSHPFIARLLDGGVNEDGELYLAMEYVDGISIVRYCEQHQLSLRDRLRLFKSVCSAVQYAHQNLVIHRDLKPDNILVTADGTPRLLDFGTAKLLSDLPGETVSDLTLPGLRSFTPQYASPEQVLGRSISTSSDIYSLGVILYQLLAGTPPYVLKEFNTEEMLRVICTDPVRKPSTVSPSAVHLDADLDAIVLRVLRKEPEERYPTVEQLSTDIQAWLDGQPVIARHGTFRYRAEKFARRNKLALSVAGLLVIAILSGIAGVLWQSRVAGLERSKAEANAEEMRQLSSSFLSEIDAAVRELPGSTPVRRLMVQRVLERLDHLANNAAGDRLTQLYLVDAYIHLGSLQGNPYGQNIGDSRGALESMDKALALIHTLRSAYPNDRDALDTLALANMTRSRILYGVGRTPEAVESIKTAIAILDSETKSSSASVAKIAETANAYHVLGDELGEPESPSIGDYPGALAAYQSSYDLYRRALAIDPNFMEARREIALNPLSVACILMLTNPAGAITEIQRSIALWNSVPVSSKSDVNDRRTILYDSIRLAHAFTLNRDYAAATATYEAALKRVEKNAAFDANDSRAQADVAGIRGGEADTYADMLNPLLNPGGQKDRRANALRALQLIEGSIPTIERLVSLDPSNQDWAAYLAYEKTMLGTLKQELGRSDEGAHLASSGIVSLRQFASTYEVSEDALIHITTVMLTVLPVQLRDSRLAVQYAERLAALSHRKDPNCLLLLSQAYRADGQSEKARATAQEGLALLPPSVPGMRAGRCRVLLEDVLSKNRSGDGQRARSRGRHLTDSSLFRSSLSRGDTAVSTSGTSPDLSVRVG